MVQHLESIVEDATTTDSLRGVYWCARDLSGTEVFKAFGNHHFLLLLFRDEAEALAVTASYPVSDRPLSYVTTTNDKGLTIYFTTLGVALHDGKIDLYVNDGDDGKALGEAADTDRRPWLSDLDFEGHRIPPLPGWDDRALMRSVCDLWRDYTVERVSFGLPAADYHLMDDNCAALVDTFLRVLGYPAEQREDLGEMDGIDWGEEDSVPLDLHSAMSHAMPQTDWTGIRDVRLELTATCRTASQQPRTTTLDITYLRHGRIDNIDGALTWTPTGPQDAAQPTPQRPCVPAGSYLDSLVPAEPLVVTLSASCQTDDGTWVSRTLEVTDVVGATVRNDHGQLVVAPDQVPMYA